MVILMNYLSVDPIDPKIGIYVEHATPIQKQLLVRDVSIVDATNLVGCGVGVEGVGVDDIDGDCDDNDVDEVDVEEEDGALVDDEFEESGNVVDEGNGIRGKDGNVAVSNVDYEWYDSDYDNPANEQLY